MGEGTMGQIPDFYLPNLNQAFGVLAASGLYDFDTAGALSYNWAT
jgi:hypothetical protein